METPEPKSASSKSLAPGHLSAVEVVWQWLSYSLWELTLLALSALLSIVLTYFLDYSAYDTSHASLFALAAVICLLPLAFIINRVFAKTEPLKKEGFAGVVMVLNAVLVVLAAIAAVVVAVVSLLSEALGGVTAVDNISAATAVIVAALGVMLSIRIVRPARLVKFAAAFPYVMLAISGAAIVLVVAGPFAHGVRTQQDRLIENNLPTLDQDIQDYAVDNNVLPPNLQAINFDNEQDTGPQSGQELVKRHLVTYKFDNTTQLYQLCVPYRQARRPALTSASDDTSISTSSHAAGLVCYHQSATSDITAPDHNSASSQ